MPNPVALRYNWAYNPAGHLRNAAGLPADQFRTDNSKVIDKIEKIRSYKVRRAKLFYLRGLRGKAARLKEIDRESGTVRA